MSYNDTLQELVLLDVETQTFSELALVGRFLEKNNALNGLYFRGVDNVQLESDVDAIIESFQTFCECFKSNRALERLHLHLETRAGTEDLLIQILSCPSSLCKLKVLNGKQRQSRLPEIITAFHKNSQLIEFGIVLESFDEKFLETIHSSKLTTFIAKPMKIPSGSLGNIPSYFPPNLRMLDMSEVNLSSGFLKNLVAASKNLQIQGLDLSQCGLTDVHIEMIAELIISCSPSLKSLRIQQNIFTKSSYGQIFCAILECQNLARLVFGNIDDEDGPLLLLQRVLESTVLQISQVNYSQSARDQKQLSLICKEGFAQNRSIVVFGATLPGPSQEAMNFALKTNTTLCELQCSWGDESISEKLLKNNAWMSDQLRFCLAQFLQLHLSRVSKTTSALVDFPNLFEMVWMYAASWLKAFTTGQLDWIMKTTY
eukprot:TRINITY_DN5071_c0_g1_i10.p1 TRINITY_DN5071_c0_g1~~TRINITY_DN5071_c0_g1_i10.p1  ORF type:complete len:428 (+),score=85.21 TRINITY_DN5071_c0_g1_i10:582-1865(+)